jgi:uncharacterized protein (DUF433 family)
LRESKINRRDPLSKPGKLSFGVEGIRHFFAIIMGFSRFTQRSSPPVLSDTEPMAQAVITRDPDILGGAAVFRGTRVPFQALLDYIEGGETIDAFLEQFPTITREMAVPALESAKDSLLARIA